jgi:hypothetical protein
MKCHRRCEVTTPTDRACGIACGAKIEQTFLLELAFQAFNAKQRPQAGAPHAPPLAEIRRAPIQRRQRAHSTSMPFSGFQSIRAALLRKTRTWAVAFKNIKCPDAARVVNLPGNPKQGKAGLMNSEHVG